MKLSKFILLIFFVTIIALVYVYQQNEIFYLAYLGGRKQAMLADLLDKNNIFRYNINKFSSLTCLDGNVLREVDFEMPAVKQLVRLNSQQNNLKISRESSRKLNLLFTFFGRTRQAQAETINRYK